MEGEWSASGSSHFTPGWGALDTHWTEICVCLRADLDAVEKRKHCWLCQESNPVSWTVQPTARRHVVPAAAEASIIKSMMTLYSSVLFHGPNCCRADAWSIRPSILDFLAAILIEGFLFNVFILLPDLYLLNIVTWRLKSGLYDVHC
jgi:hypothetical protein